MEGYSSYFQSSAAAGNGNQWGYDTFKNFRHFSPIVQSHLQKVYLTLCFALVASAIGSYLHILLNIGGLLTTLACLGCMTWLLSISPHEESKRTGLLMAAAVFEGASIGPLVQLAVAVDPSILVSAFVGCAIAFGCFSAAAMLARRQEYLWVGALCSSGLSMLFWLQIASSLFGGLTSMFKFELYFGLLVFVGYIVFDTQMIIEKAHQGDLDHVKHALTLFTDFIAVFVRILIILVEHLTNYLNHAFENHFNCFEIDTPPKLKNSTEKEEERKKKRRN